MIKRIVSFIIATIMLAFPLCIVYANDANDGSPEGVPSLDPFFTDEFTVYANNDRGNYISNHTLTLSSNSVGHVSIGVSVTTSQTMQKLGFTTLIVQHWNGSSWEDVWTKTNQFDTNTDYYAYVKTLSNMASDDYYRVSVELYAKKGFLQTQTLTLVSNYIRCK